ncbi:hypothetical protein JCM24511_08948 [Saitozyma sp. JCM 24511]|nr:hypothetical protein JCM24511_08948 [Saitozyma sp. JCM 24511]
MTVSMPHIKLYEHWESTWANVPKLAQFELGYKKEDVEWISIELLKGGNFDPKFLKVNPNGTLPVLQVDGRNFVDSITSTRELIRLAPLPCPASGTFDVGLIEKVHEVGNIQGLSIDEAEHKEKSSGLLGNFFAERQVALENLIQMAPTEYQEFLTQKRAENQQMFDFYCGSPDSTTREAHYNQCRSAWNAVGALIRGPITDALKNTKGPFAAGEHPGEADFHVATWLARTISNAGVSPNSPSSVAIPKLKERTGGDSYDPCIAKYWDAWIVRPSFKESHVD